ncbi:MAG: hypothetical protein PHQ64_04465 [Bacilli bacterium]|nr:hypothetical protein [Bacilli bacterium]
MKKLLIELVIGTVLFGIGCGYMPFEIMNFDFKDELPKGEFNYNTREIRETISLDNNYIVSNNLGSAKVVIDDSLVDEMVINVKYVDGYYANSILRKEINGNEYNYYLDTKVKFNTSNVKKVFKNIKRNIKDREFYDYSKLFTTEIIVYVNSSYKDKILVNENIVEAVFDSTDDSYNVEVNF